MTTIALVWYALGWANCGMEFSTTDEGLTFMTFWACHIAAPALAVFFVIAFAVIAICEAKKSQYLWRKP